MQRGTGQLQTEMNQNSDHTTTLLKGLIPSAELVKQIYTNL